MFSEKSLATPYTKFGRVTLKGQRGGYLPHFGGGEALRRTAGDLCQLDERVQRRLFDRAGNPRRRIVIARRGKHRPNVVNSTGLVRFDEPQDVAKTANVGTNDLHLVPHILQMPGGAGVIAGDHLFAIRQ